MDNIQYERITDDICFLGNNAILKFNVQLARKDKSQNRYHYHTEYVYSCNDKYINADELVSLKRQFTFYLTIDVLQYKGRNRPWIQISPSDMIPLRMILDECAKWFLDKKYKNLFVFNKERKLVVYDKLSTPITLETYSNTLLEFNPSIVDEFGKSVEGINIKIVNQNIDIPMSARSFMGFKYNIDCLNMYQSAQNMINYIQKPKYPKRIKLNLDMKNNNASDISSPIKNRIPVGERKNKKESLSDKIGGILNG